MAARNGEILGFASDENKIYKWSRAGYLEGTFGSQGDGRGMFGELIDLAANAQGNLIALDRAHGDVQVFSFINRSYLSDATPRFAFSAAQAGVEPIASTCIALLPDGEILFDATAQRVLVQRGEDRDVYTHAGFVDVSAALVDAEFACFFDRFHHKVFVFNVADGSFAFDFEAPGKRGGLVDVRRMLPGPQGTWYLADAGATKVHVFSRDGIFLTSVGDEGSGAPD